MTIFFKSRTWCVNKCNSSSIFSHINYRRSHFFTSIDMKLQCRWVKILVKFVNGQHWFQLSKWRCLKPQYCAGYICSIYLSIEKFFELGAYFDFTSLYGSSNRIILSIFTLLLTDKISTTENFKTKISIKKTNADNGLCV